MKKSFLTVLFLFALTSLACAGTSVTLQWNANTETDMAGYRVYQDGEKIADIACMASDTACCTWTSGELNEPHEWYVTAYDTDGFESGPSNTVDSYPPNVPENLNISINITINP